MARSMLWIGAGITIGFVLIALLAPVIAPYDFDTFRASVEGDKRTSLKVMREADYFEKQSEALSGFLSGMGIAFAIMFSLAAMLGAAITMNGAVAGRSREIGTLRALGSGFIRARSGLRFLSPAREDLRLHRVPVES